MRGFGVVSMGNLCGMWLDEASMSSSSVLAVKRMEGRKRRMESIRDIEDDAGPLFKLSRLAESATNGSKYSIWATN